MTRAPWAERPATLREFCSCPKDDEGARETAFIDRPGARDWYYLTDPTCRLHGEHAEPSPY